MSILRLFSSRSAPKPVPSPATAPIARERLQILLAHERGVRGQPDLLMQLREEILAVVSRHVTLDPDKVIVRMDRGKHVSTLEVDIELPSGIEKKLAATG
jgi:cell division topological specificity factor